MLIMTLLLGQFIDGQDRALRRDGCTQEEAAQIRTRKEIATRLRGKLPLSIDYGPPDDDE